MIHVTLPHDVSLADTTVFGIARSSGPAWVTLRDVLAGRGTPAPLDRVRAALDLRWIWTMQTDPGRAGAGLASPRKAKAAQAARDGRTPRGQSPGPWSPLETGFRGRIEALRRHPRVPGPQKVRAASGPGKRLVPASSDPSADPVFTPAVLAARIAASFEDEIRGRVLDPSRGRGAFHDALPDHVTKDWREVSKGRDVFDGFERVDRIVTDPP